MADIEGAWTPSDETEMDFIVNLNALVREAHDRGVALPDIASGLAFMAAVVGEQDGEELGTDGPDLPAPSDKPDTCPECDRKIGAVKPFMGQKSLVEPCGCMVDHDRLGEWVETPEGTDA